MTTLRSPHSDIENARHEPYLLVFLLGFAVLFITIFPLMLVTGGYFIYYGDFNSQQLPFYYHAHEMVQSGAFGWDWQTDLGANFIGSYSFYLLGSPFFWATALVPQRFVLYMMPYLLALKHAFAALTAYAYIRRFVRSRQAAMIGSLLYAYSGFQLFNIFFNHFQDVTAFFPLLLIALEQRVNENRRCVFALAVAMMAVLNYFFFTGEVVFVLLYFIFRCGAKDFRISFRKFCSIAFESVLGVALAAFMLLPSALAILENNRVDDFLLGMDMVAYTDRTRLFRIIESFFMMPDAPARPNLFQSDYGKWASIGGYLPLFSMAGVIAFMSQKRKHWATRVTAVCIFCAFIPVLNSAFYMLNASYYARWFFMPILLMALMTAYALDNPAIKWRSGMLSCLAVMIFCGIVSLLPTKGEDGGIEWLKFAKYPWYFWITLVLCLGMLYIARLLLRRRAHGIAFLHIGVYMTAIGCLAASCAMVYFGIGLGADPFIYKKTAINGGREIALPAADNQFYRVDIAENYDNYPMFWGYSNMRCFQSVVPVSVMEFYKAIDITRDVASRAEHKDYPLRGLLNVKYYFDRVPENEEERENYTRELDMPGFKYLEEAGGFYIYENEAYIPMGVAYDSYVTAAEMEPCTALVKEKTMLQALILDDAQAETYGAVLQKLNGTDRYAMNESQYVEYCKARAAQTCTAFNYDSHGFTASITLDAPAMVFFSVPYEAGWSADVNGNAASVERVNYGFMAVYCEAGENAITFRYETPGLRIGLWISAGAAGVFVIYLLIASAVRLKRRKPHPYEKHSYDYAPAVPFPEHELYQHYTKQRYRFAGEQSGEPKNE